MEFAKERTSTISAIALFLLWLGAIPCHAVENPTRRIEPFHISRVGVHPGQQLLDLVSMDTAKLKKRLSSFHPDEWYESEFPMYVYGLYKESAVTTTIWIYTHAKMSFGASVEFTNPYMGCHADMLRAFGIVLDSQPDFGCKGLEKRQTNPHKDALAKSLGLRSFSIWEGVQFGRVRYDLNLQVEPAGGVRTLSLFRYDLAEIDTKFRQDFSRALNDRDTATFGRFRRKLMHLKEAGNGNGKLDSLVVKIDSAIGQAALRTRN